MLLECTVPRVTQSAREGGWRTGLDTVVQPSEDCLRTQNWRMCPPPTPGLAEVARGYHNDCLPAPPLQGGCHGSWLWDGASCLAKCLHQPASQAGRPNVMSMSRSPHLPLTPLPLGLTGLVSSAVLYKHLSRFEGPKWGKTSLPVLAPPQTG